MGVEAAGEIPSLTGEFVGETHRILEHTQNQPPKNQHQKGPICLWVAGEVTESQSRAKQAALFPLRTLPHIQQCGLPHPGEHLKLHPLLCNRPTETKIMAQMKERIKPPEKIQLSDEKIAKLPDAQFKTLVIRMLTEMIEYGHNIEEKVKAMKSEIKENVQGTNSEGKENRDSNQRFGPEGRNKHSTKIE